MLDSIDMLEMLESNNQLSSGEQVSSTVKTTRTVTETVKVDGITVKQLYRKFDAYDKATIKSITVYDAKMRGFSATDLSEQCVQSMLYRLSDELGDDIVLVDCSYTKIEVLKE